ncbi:MAG TPA: hypothetical protein VJU86_18760 [Pyrinomonadaceae bacterium]|nr:hypothetical protein [Pyrinomonadaceae bacterium]
MKKRTTRQYIPLLICALLLIPSNAIFAQQSADPHFDVRVEHPAYSKSYPRVMFDEAHNNFHTVAGRYKPFADLLFNDGYQVVVNRKPFSKESLRTFKVLIIANAMGTEEMDDEGAQHSPFTTEEINVVRDWVKDGGAMLLIADHAPFGGAAEALAKPFSVTMSKGFVFDPPNSQSESASLLIFSRENKLLLDHPITKGRNDTEKIDRVLTFTGQAVNGGEGSASFLKLSDTARDTPDRTGAQSVSVAGQSQGLAIKFGKGRVVIMGEAAMLSAQVAGADNKPMGMNVPGSNNKQLALNIMHWLSGALK